ncbi:hypothetical protein [Hydrogenophaga sp. OTU3427]|uniref:hypothetical protein n=1 Tax=Hydrogenophaga sp. OTU3427 TaxID=3043856 RepID=UPI00313AEBBD
MSVTYAYGSRPGQARDLAVTGFSADETAIMVREQGVADEKVYVVARIMEIRTQDGLVATNHQTTRSYQESLRQRLERERERSAIIDVCASGHPRQLLDMRFIVIPAAGSYSIVNQKNKQTAQVRALNLDGGNRAAFAVEMMLGRSSGLWWEIQGVMVKCQVYWPQWMQLREAAHAECRRIAAQYRDENPDLQWEALSFRERCDHYRKSPLWKLDNWEYMDWGRIFEAQKVDIEACLRILAEVPLSLEEYKQYILSSNGPQTPLTLPDDHISQQALEKLLTTGLAKRPDPLTLEDVLSKLKTAELKAIAKPLGIKVSALKKAELIAQCLQAIPPDQASRLIADATAPDAYVLQPPDGLTWEEFQDFKSCYRQMFSMLAAWLDGEHEFSAPVVAILG